MSAIRDLFDEIEKDVLDLFQTAEERFNDELTIEEIRRLEELGYVDSITNFGDSVPDWDDTMGDE